MKKSISRSVFVALIAGFTAASGAVMSAPLGRASSFDGNWSVVIHTRQGDCGESLRYSVRIVGGQVQSGEQNYRAAGAVSPNGAIRVMVAEGDRAASGGQAFIFSARAPSATTFAASSAAAPGALLLPPAQR